MERLIASRNGAAVALGLLLAFLTACESAPEERVRSRELAQRSFGQTLDDIDTLGRLVDRFGDAGPEFDDVDVDVIEGRVLLTGPVPNDRTRADATRMAYAERGVLEVLNELQVDDGKGFFSATVDARITTQLRTRLQGSKKIISSHFEIKTHRRTVYLIGVARDDAERQAVIEQARRVGGVRRVVDHMILANDGRRRGL